MPDDDQQNKSDFESTAQGKPMSLPMEFFLFIRENKAWWMVPILVLLALIGLLAAFGSSGNLPWIYTFF